MFPKVKSKLFELFESYIINDLNQKQTKYLKIVSIIYKCNII